MASVQESHGRALLVRVQLRVTLIGRNHKIVLIRQRYQLPPMLQFEHGAGGVAGGGDVQQLAVAPKVRVLSGKAWDKIPVGVAIEKRGLGSGGQSGALVNLIVGVGADEARVTLVTIHHRLGDGEKFVPGASNQQDMLVYIEAARG